MSVVIHLATSNLPEAIQVFVVCVPCLPSAIIPLHNCRLETKSQRNSLKDWPCRQTADIPRGRGRRRFYRHHRTPESSRCHRTHSRRGNQAAQSPPTHGAWQQEGIVCRDVTCILPVSGPEQMIRYFPGPVTRDSHDIRSKCESLQVIC